MAARFLGGSCERARAGISARLDGQLSELGRVRLKAHLAQCGSCRAYARGAGTATELLRATPLEQPDFEIVLPRSRHRSARLIQTATAAVAAAAVAALAIGGAPRGAQTNSPTPAPQQEPTFLQSPSYDLQILHRAPPYIPPGPRAHLAQ